MANSTTTAKSKIYTVEFDREKDGRWIAEIAELPGVMVYGASREDAFGKVRALAFRVISEMEDSEEIPLAVEFSVA